MTTPFVGEIKIFAGNFAPTGHALCNGQLMPISQNTALFSILGTTYGGDGKSTFALPDLQGRSPMHPGQGPGLSLHILGEQSGTETETLGVTQMPAHVHALSGSTAASASTPSNGLLGQASAPVYGGASNLVQMASQAVSAVGGAQPHDNRQPYLALTFIIALQGVFPPRS